MLPVRPVDLIEQTDLPSLPLECLEAPVCGINRHQPWHGLATCYEEWAANYRAGDHRVYRHLAWLVIRQTGSCILVISTKQYNGG